MIGLQDPGLIERVRQVAFINNRDETHLISEAVEYYLAQLDYAKIDAETDAFHAMYHDLEAIYPGQFVAIHQGRLIDHDVDVVSLEKRVRAQLGRVAVLVTPVAQEKDLLFVSSRLEHLDVPL